MHLMVFTYVGINVTELRQYDKIQRPSYDIKLFSQVTGS